VASRTVTRFCITATLFVCVMLVSTASAWAAQSGRVYEQVSPEFKGGYGARDIQNVQTNGESIIYDSFGTFAGSSSTILEHYYQANRNPTSGWQSSALNPPAALSPRADSFGFSSSLGTSLWYFPLHSKNIALANDISTEAQFYTGTNGEFNRVGPTLEDQNGKPLEFGEEGVSSDFCHIVIKAAPLTAEALAAEAEQLYDIDTCDLGVTKPQLVAVTDNGSLLSPACQPGVGSRNAVSSDGNTIIFTALPSQHCFVASAQLFARLGGDKTLEISKPLEEECTEVPCPGVSRASASFQGASQDGSKIFFTTAASLNPATDKDKSEDLYMAVIGCPSSAVECDPAQLDVTSLVQVSRDPNIGEAADVQGVVAMSPDGSHVYFVARGVLASQGLTVEGAQSLAVKGADNLYSYEHDAQYPEGRVVFVGDLCSGPRLSGEVLDSRCPADLEDESSNQTPPRNDLDLMGSGSLSQTTGAGGGVLVFSSYSQLIDGGVEADNDDAQDIYRFDSGSGVMQRVSLGENGADTNGNQNDGKAVTGVSEEFRRMEDADARIQPSVTKETAGEEFKVVRQASDEDGSRIVFTTAEPLSPKASNGQADIYEWDEGRVSLISTGSSTEADESAVITPAGNDVFFISAQGLIRQDTDGAPDIYDARLGGGFPQPAEPPERCSGDACQGPLSSPAAVLVPGSVSQPGETSLSPSSPKVTKVKTSKKAKTKKKKAKSHTRSKRAKRARRREGRRG
jgi:hypothetical protein